MLFRLFIVAGLALSLWTGMGPFSAKADSTEALAEAQAALAAGDYDAAFLRYSRLAEERNDPLAQFTLALFHQMGWGRPVDLAEACRWHEKAAVQGVPTAQDFHAQCLDGGTGRPADPAAAAEWYQKAADSGHLLSLCALADLHIRGRGVPKDPARGLALCRQAAESGLVAAQVRMGRFHLDGDEAVRDLAAAFQWFVIAAQSGSPEAQYRLGVMTRDGIGGPRDLAAARTWFESAAAQGYPPAYFPTARLYFQAPADPETGLQRPEDLAKAYLWLSATTEREPDPDRLAQTADMLEQVVQVMPETWVADLDAQVARHLATYASAPEDEEAAK